MTGEELVKLMKHKIDSKNYMLAGYRTMLGCTQEDLANILGISKQSYNQKELGKTRFSDEEKIIIKNFINDYFPEVSYDILFFS